MAANDDLTLGEIARSLDRLDKAQRQLAIDSVPAKQYEVAHQALIDRQERHEREARDIQTRLEKDAAERNRAVDREIRDLKTALAREIESRGREIEALRKERAKRAEMTWQKITGLVAALAGAALVIVTLLGQTGGH